VLVVLMGCSQAFPDRPFDTGIPFITKSVTLPFKHVPMAYLGICFTTAFLFEMAIDWSLLPGLWICWLLMRLVIRTRTSPMSVGDSSPQFALHTFFPERMRPYLEYLSNLSFSVANSCRLISAT
jgi:hypothetical protein